MLIQDFLLYFILTVLAIVVLETAIIMGFKLYIEIYTKFKERKDGK